MSIIYNSINLLSIFLLYPLNYIFSTVIRFIPKKRHVLHISYSVHIAYYTTRILRENKIQADYLSVDPTNHWNKFDYFFDSSKRLFFLNEFLTLWTLLARYKIIHIHFLYTLSKTGWEIKFLKKSNIKIIIHYRGNESRNLETIKKLYDDFQCKNLDKYVLTDWQKKKRKMESFADQILVTTRDLLDFSPNAIHMPFFSPAIKENVFNKNINNLRIVHATNQPNVEGTEQLIQILNDLKKEGFKFDLINVRNKTYNETMKILRKSHLSIGKMKMGDYANFQVESMYLGIPVITYVRKDILERFSYLKSSGIIFTDFKSIKFEIRKILKNPKKLITISKKIKTFSNNFHNNKIISNKYDEIYTNVLLK